MSGASPDCISVGIFYEAKPAWPESLDTRLSGQAGFASIKVIEMSYIALVKNFTDAIDPGQTSVYQLPQHILVFGGRAGVGEKFKKDESCRHVFINKSEAIRPELARNFIIPESYPDWNLIDGYDNLVDFELDAGYLAKAIVLFVETPGSIAELGSFCMDDTLRQRLFVVVNQKHAKAANSFIINGPVKLIKKHTEDLSVCVAEFIETPIRFEDEVVHVLEALEEKIQSEISKPRFSTNRERDLFLLIADLVDLFRALLAVEIEELLLHFDVALEKKRLNQMIWQLKLFNLIQEVQVYGKTYYVAFKGKDHQFLDYTSKKEKKSFSRPGFKTQVIAAFKSDAKRKKAIDDGK